MTFPSRDSRVLKPPSVTMRYLLMGAGCLSGHVEVVKLLVSHGAEVTCKDKLSYTPLHAAASSGMIGVVKYLLGLGVDVSPGLPFTADGRAEALKSTGGGVICAVPCHQLISAQ